MTKKRNNKKSNKRRSESLPREDQSLWDRVAESIDPLSSPKKHVLARDDVDELAAYLDQHQPHKKHAPGGNSLPYMATEPQNPPKTKIRSAPYQAPPQKTVAPPLANFEVRKARRIRSGAISIDGRVDLHGMRQTAARSALRSFLISSQARGDRCVLVITGKGQKLGQEDPRDIPFDSPNEQTERGVLRRRVPQWLQEPELRTVVVSFTMAAPHHGGDGAMYVQLRSRRKGHK